MLNKKEFLSFAVKFLIISTSLSLVFGFIAENSSETTEFTARASSFAVNLLGVKSTAENNMIKAGSLEVKIIPLCTGYISASILIGFIAAFPADKRKKIIGAIIFTPLVYAATVARLATSFYIGNSYGTESFTVMHDFLWQFGMMAVVVFFALLWLHFIVKKESVSKNFTR